ncbi:hypothetical protein RBB50_000072 [Rhinocladiella similis]
MSGYRGSSTSPRPPRSVQQITKAAQEYEYDAQIPLRIWLRSAQAMLKQADTYMREGDEETTYMLFFRYAHLILSQLPQHPQYRDKTATHLQGLMQEAEKEVNDILKMLDLMKPRINERYNRYVKVAKEREARRMAQTQQYQPVSGPAIPSQRSQPLQAHENKEFALRLAQKEISRRAANRQNTSTSGRDSEDLSSRLQELRARVDGRQLHSLDTGTRPHPSAESGLHYHYPTVPSQHVQPIASPPAIPPSQQSYRRDIPLSPPVIPPKPRSETAAAPVRPEKISTQSEVDLRAVTPEPTHVFAPAAYLENGEPLRTVFLPPELRTTFLRIAYKNTRANLETCGFLAGTLIANAFFISRLIIPSQTSTSDTCEMTNESQLFDYVDKEDLMVLGWIHTHPTQTCFMSSRDLHTHAGYQMMLAESIAIVCAPSRGDVTHGGDWGAFRLTDPPGKKTILNCDQPGVFHPHAVENIYTDALRPGHVVEAKGMQFEVVDLRDK